MWMQFHEVADPVMRVFGATAIMAMDRVWLEWASDKAEADAKRTKAKGKGK